MLTLGCAAFGGAAGGGTLFSVLLAPSVLAAADTAPSLNTPLIPLLGMDRAAAPRPARRQGARRLAAQHPPDVAPSGAGARVRVQSVCSCASRPFACMLGICCVHANTHKTRTNIHSKTHTPQHTQTRTRAKGPARRLRLHAGDVQDGADRPLARRAARRDRVRQPGRQPPRDARGAAHVWRLPPGQPRVPGARGCLGREGCFEGGRGGAKGAAGTRGGKRTRPPNGGASPDLNCELPAHCACGPSPSPHNPHTHTHVRTQPQHGRSSSTSASAT